ncbi:MAG: aminotransferase class I/II-fold pyridoxal phosphate-dependent enzyme, partial [Cyanobacteria bacterium REEB65]|nr:aminotransferase class I/II-fold pyridoxal phosphate-dependent enzyme [Cyanobacteria bacterium REEB65]
HYQRRYGVTLDPQHEVLVLIGGKEGFVHGVNALLDRHEGALVPNPGYPVYGNQVRLAGGRVHDLVLQRQLAWKPDWETVDPQGARLAFLNYPNNPTGAVCAWSDLAEAVDFCRRHGIALIHDLAYGELVFEGITAPSLLQVDGAKEVGIEIMSLSKTYRMAGMRLGAAVGNASLVGAMRVLKSHADTGQFRAIQRAAIAALDGPQDHLAGDRAVYRARADRAVAALRRIGLDPDMPGGSLYVWARLPEGRDDEQFAHEALANCGVLLAPGRAYGDRGRGYVRLSLTLSDDRLAEALDRLHEGALL